MRLGGERAWTVSELRLLKVRARVEGRTSDEVDRARFSLLGRTPEEAVDAVNLIASLSRVRPRSGFLA